MNYENVQKELFERKLRIGEYFKLSIKILKDVIKENKLWILFFVIGYVWFSITDIMMKDFSLKIQQVSLEMEKSGSYQEIEVLKEYLGSLILIFFTVVVTSLCTGFIGMVVCLKAAYKIEGNEDEFSLKKTFIKYLKVMGIGILIVIIFGILGMILSMFQAFVALIAGIDPVSIIGVIQIITMIICGVIAFFMIIKILYFSQVYYVRDMTIIDSFKYNLKLSKKNVLRIAVPIFSITIINIVISILIDKMMFFVPDYIAMSIKIMDAVFTSILALISIIMNIVIFLNVEYDYLKKQDEKIEKIEENA